MRILTVLAFGVVFAVRSRQTDRRTDGTARDRRRDCKPGFRPRKESRCGLDTSVGRSVRLLMACWLGYRVVGVDGMYGRTKMEGGPGERWVLLGVIGNGCLDFVDTVAGVRYGYTYRYGYRVFILRLQLVSQDDCRW